MSGDGYPAPCSVPFLVLRPVFLYKFFGWMWLEIHYQPSILCFYLKSFIHSLHQYLDGFMCFKSLYHSFLLQRISLTYHLALAEEWLFSLTIGLASQMGLSMSTNISIEVIPGVILEGSLLRIAITRLLICILVSKCLKCTKISGETITNTKLK